MVKELDDVILEAMCYYFIGVNYQSINEYDKALNYYQKALKLYGDENEEEEIATIYDGLGYLYKNFNQINRAKEYYTLAIEINKRLGFYLSSRQF